MGIYLEWLYSQREGNLHSVTHKWHWHRVIPLTGHNWCTYYTCLRKHLKCHFLQITLNNRLLYILQPSIKVSLIAVRHRWVEEIQVLWAPWDSSADWGDENRSHEVPGSCWFHQVIRGKEGYQGEGLIWLVEVKLYNSARIRVRVACSTDQLSKLVSTGASL